VQLGEQLPHLLARYIPPELREIVYINGHDVSVRWDIVRGGRAAHPVSPPVPDRGKGLHRRGVGLLDSALVVLQTHTLLEVDQHDHGSYAGSSPSRAAPGTTGLFIAGNAPLAVRCGGFAQ
jgi:hypothetical protein